MAENETPDINPNPERDNQNARPNPGANPVVNPAPNPGPNPVPNLAAANPIHANNAEEDPDLQEDKEEKQAPQNAAPPKKPEAPLDEHSPMMSLGPMFENLVDSVIKLRDAFKEKFFDPSVVNILLLPFKAIKGAVKGSFNLGQKIGEWDTKRRLPKTNSDTPDTPVNPERDENLENPQQAENRENPIEPNHPGRNENIEDPQQVEAPIESIESIAALPGDDSAHPLDAENYEFDTDPALDLEALPGTYEEQEQALNELPDNNQPKPAPDHQPNPDIKSPFEPL